MFGVLADHAVGLISGNLAVQAGFAWIGLAGLGLTISLAVQSALKRPKPATPNREHESISLAVSAAAATLILAAAGLAIYAEPIGDWDARSIWFFHAKAIYFDHGLHPSEFWANPEYFWSHKDYPKLVSMLAARYADYLPGGWNEYAPKGALTPLLCTGVLGLMAAVRPSAAFPLLLVGLTALLGVQLWNGYQDGLLALHGAVAITALARWASEGDRKDLMLGCAALAIALCLKNEGQLLFVVGLCGLLYGAYRQRRHLRPRDAAALILLVPFAAWMWLSPQLPASGDLHGAGLLKDALARVLDPPELARRLASLIQAVVERTMFAQSLAAFVVVALCLGLSRSAAMVGAAALLYVAGTFAVYLGTPVDFEWHIATSIDRVMMLPTALLLTGSAILASKFSAEVNVLAARFVAAARSRA